MTKPHDLDNMDHDAADTKHSEETLARLIHEQGGVRNRATGGRVDHRNINSEPSEAQKKAGNYAKDHVVIQGMPITIENARGSIRRGKGPNPWQVKMPAHYGYFKKTEGRDGDHVDVYVGTHLLSPKAFVVDQINADDKSFDEHKVMLGFGSKTEAIHTYNRAFSDGRGLDRLGHIHEMSIPDLKAWLNSNSTKHPIKKITRDAFLYLEPKKGHPNPDFAQCNTCYFLTKARCLLHGPDVEIDANKTCAFYIEGKPQPHLFGRERVLVTPEQSGLIKAQVRCENCLYTSGSDNGCGLFRMLNQRQPEDFDLDPDIHPQGCCNGWAPRKDDASE